jgi:hypothetical protein
MQNPCDKCIVKINCTQICWEKTNNQTLLKNAMNQVTIRIGHKQRINHNYFDTFHKYNRLYNECIIDMESIRHRAKEAKG